MLPNLITYRLFGSVFIPRLDSNVIDRHGRERIDEGSSQAVVGDERHVEVNGCTTDLKADGELAGCEVLGDVDHHVNLLLKDHVESLRLQLLRGPIDMLTSDVVLDEIAIRTARGVELITLVSQLLAGC